MSSKVYFSDFRAKPGLNLLQKLQNLVVTAGLKDIDFTNKFVAIKIHFGEPGNLAYLRPNYAKVLVDLVKELGGKPFLTDCNTLYVGRRKDALEHMEAAYENGYNPFATGCHIIIADGLKGTDEAYIKVQNGEYVQEAKIGRAVADADIIISLSHFKGHEMTGFGGAIKNLGMGCGSRAGKMEMHSSGKPRVLSKKCVGCMVCTKVCAHSALNIIEKKAVINKDLCVGCGRCIGMCSQDAIVPPWDESFDILNAKMAEYTMAVVQGKPHFHITLVMDVSPYCDCHAENDIPIIADVGMFASCDPIALDRACADACNSAPIVSGSILDEQLHSCDEQERGCADRFNHTTHGTNWVSALEHGEKIGLGTQKYELIKV